MFSLHLYRLPKVFYLLQLMVKYSDPMLICVARLNGGSAMATLDYLLSFRGTLTLVLFSSNIVFGSHGPDENDHCTVVSDINFQDRGTSSHAMSLSGQLRIHLTTMFTIPYVLPWPWSDSETDGNKVNQAKTITDYLLQLINADDKI